jgi:hypothetical protein
MGFSGNRRIPRDTQRELPGLSKFRLSYEKRVISRIDEIEISIIGYTDLIQNKETLGRPKDIEDIQQLKLRKKDG